MVFEKFTSADLFQIAREKSCDYLLMNVRANIWLAFPLLRVTVCHRSLFPPTNDNLVTSRKIGQNFDRWTGIKTH